MLRIELPDLPGSLSKVANVIATVNGDINAVEVKGSSQGVAVDDVWVTIDHPDALVSAFETVEGVRILYIGPSRGLPAVNTMRMCAIVQNVLTGTMGFDDGVIALVGGNLCADSVTIESPRYGDYQKDRRVLRILLGDRELVATREYRFLDEEVRQAMELTTLCTMAADRAVAL